MRTGAGGTVPSYNVQLVTDTTQGLVVNVEATTDAIDYRQLQPALDRCRTDLGTSTEKTAADGDYRTMRRCKPLPPVESTSMVPGKIAGSQRSATHKAVAAPSSGGAFSYDPEHDVYLCPAGNDSLTMPP